jgi:hypothetical protein
MPDALQAVANSQASERRVHPHLWVGKCRNSYELYCLYPM